MKFWLGVMLCFVVSLPDLGFSGQETQTLEGVRAGQSNERTRLVLDFTGPVQYEAAASADKLRLLVTVFNSEFELTGDTLPTLSAPIERIILERYGDNGLQLDVATSKAVDAHIFTLPPGKGRGHRLVVDLLYTPTQDDVAAFSFGGKSDPEEARAYPTKEHDSNNGSFPYQPVFSGTWEQEWAVETEGVDSQKFEALLEPEMDWRFANNLSLTAIARVRLDTVGDLGPDADRPDNYSKLNGPLYNTAHAEVSIREAYVDYQSGSMFWRIGKQQVVWGQADGIKVLDVVNPQSFREFILDDFDDSRIPLTMANLEMPIAEYARLQLLWIPDTTYHELAEPGTPFFITSPRLVPTFPADVQVDVKGSQVPDKFLEDSDFGIRVSMFLGGWDITANYLYHYQDYPVYYQRMGQNDGETRAIVEPEYERNHLLGGTLSNAFGDFTLRAEIAYSTDTYHISRDIGNRGINKSDELGSVIGLDWQLGKHNTFLSVQWFQSHLFDFKKTVTRDRTEHNLSLYYQRDFANDTLRLDALALYSPNENDSQLQLKLKYLWLSNLELWIGADLFQGSQKGLFGQFDDRDRVLLGFELGF